MGKDEKEKVEVPGGIFAEPQFDLETFREIRDLVKAEYDSEVKRFSSFEVRTGILFALTGALVPVATKFFCVPNNKFGLLFVIVIILLELASVISMIIAGLYFFLLLRVRPVETIDVEEITSDIFLSLGHLDLLWALIKTYKDATVKTRKSTEKRVNSYQNGLMWIGVAMIFAFITMALLVMFSGGG